MRAGRKWTNRRQSVRVAASNKATTVVERIEHYTQCVINAILTEFVPQTRIVLDLATFKLNDQNPSPRSSFIVFAEEVKCTSISFFFFCESSVRVCQRCPSVPLCISLVFCTCLNLLRPLVYMPLSCKLEGEIGTTRTYQESSSLLPWRAGRQTMTRGESYALPIYEPSS